MHGYWADHKNRRENTIRGRNVIRNWTLVFFVLATKNPELHRFGPKSKGKSKLIRAICGKDS